jgi:hypothetical protein
MRGIAGRCERGRDVHDQHGIVGFILKQMRQRERIALGISVASDIDRIGARPNWRQCSIELFHRRRRNLGQDAAEIG